MKLTDTLSSLGNISEILPNQIRNVELVLLLKVGYTKGFKDRGSFFLFRKNCGVVGS